MLKITILIPAKDEEKTIDLVLKDLFREIDKIKDYDFEVLVVDDGCVDSTSQIAESLGAKIITNNGAHGKGKALAVGFKQATGDIIIMLDADYSHKPEELPLFIDKIKKDYGLVVGSRILGGSDEYTPVRSFGNIFLTTAFKLFFGIKLTDALNGYKAFRKEVVKNHKYHSKDFEIEIELIANALKEGYKIGEIPSHERERAGGKMKSRALIHGPKFLWKIILEGLKYRIYKTRKHD
ncbi:glycosyltransferase family 2 protein [Candidatus Woesearchaeota archaeon]|nr:glycosyltransferase family 2 protein [Candidatus Woesearchaeota archaeon]